MDKLEKEIIEHPVISFDVFGTLLRRNVADTVTVFRLIEKKYDETYGLKSNFAANRIKAEKKARKRFRYEVNLDEIYSMLSEYYSKNIVLKLRKMEIDAEISLCTANKEIMSCYQRCLEMNKRILIISDMYLPSQVIVKMLETNGIIGYDKLYVSCEYRLTKWQDGALYEVVLKECNIQASDVLHIGDTKDADFDMAKRQGLAAFLVRDNENNCRYFKDIFVPREEKWLYSCLESFIGNTIDITKSDNYKIGYEVFGPILYAYCDWLSTQIDKLSIKKLFFFSRDGYVLKKGVELLRKDVQSCYFYGSRRAIVTPYLYFCSSLYEVVDCYKSWPHHFSLAFFFGKVGLDIDDFLVICSKHGFDTNTKLEYSSFQKNNEFQQLFAELLPFIKKNAKEQLNLLLDYMTQEGLTEKVAIIDIGAGCSIENALRKIIKSANLDVDLYALYLLTDKKQYRRRRAFFDTSCKGEVVTASLRFCYMFLEIFLSAPHGTILSYKKEDDQVVPVFATYEYSRKDGFVDETEFISDMQSGALDFMKKFNEKMKNYLKLDFRVAFANFVNFGVMPLVFDAQNWGRFRLASDEFLPMAMPVNFRTFLTQPKQFRFNMNNNMWVTGFLTNFFHNSWINKLVFFLYLFKNNINKHNGGKIS